jgi:hypothetical protein
MESEHSEGMFEFLWNKAWGLLTWVHNRWGLIGDIPLILVLVVVLIWLFFPQIKERPLGPSLSRLFEQPSPSPTTAAPVSPVNLRPLCEAEKAEYGHLSIRKGEAQHHTLLEYYEAANPNLFGLISSIATDAKNGIPRHAMTLIYAPAGIGKSFVVDKIQEQFGFTNVLRLDTLKSHMNVMQQQADLHVYSGFSFTFSTMPAFKTPLRDFGALLRLFRIDHTQAPRRVIIVDSLDEVYPDDATRILELAQQFVDDDRHRRRGGFLQIFVFGRPEGFYEFLSGPHAKPSLSKQIRLDMPRYQTSGDIQFLVRDQETFKGHEPDSTTTSYVFELLRKPFLVATMRNLSLANVLIDEAADLHGASDETVKKTILDAMLNRNKKSHGRPGSEAPVYLEMLEEAAAKYASVRAGMKGQFLVSPLDTVPVSISMNDIQKKGAVLVEDLLSRSGLVFLDPADTLNLRYQFEPLWLHRYLVELFNKHISTGPLADEYQSCQ